MKSPLFVGVGVVFVLLWFVMMAFFPLALDAFKDFKVEMLALTMLCLRLYRLGGWVFLGAWAMASATLVALRAKSGWWLMMGMSVLLDVYCVGLLMPLISLANSLSGGDNAVPPALSVVMPFRFPVWILFIFLGNEMVKAALILNRRLIFAR